MTEQVVVHPFRPSLQINKFSPYVHFPSFFSKSQCSQIKQAMTSGYRAEIEGDGTQREDPKIRGTTIFGLQPGRDADWVFTKLQDAVIQANFDLWGYDLHGFYEGIQISRYDVGDHYDWHMDIGSQMLSQRKLSIVAQLSESTDYKGGELEFFKNGDAPKSIGTLILFPSFMFHRVRPILVGTRYSLVAWISGNPYK